MQKLVKRISLVMVALMTVFTALSYVPAKAATVIPKLTLVGAQKTEYTVGDRVQFTVNAPNYPGKVQYRAVLYNSATKTYKDLWNTADKYYTGWVPSGPTVFTISWPMDEAGTYRITVYAKRAYLANSKTALKGSNCDTVLPGIVFTVAPKAAPVAESIAPVADVTVNEGEAAVLPTEVTLNLSDKTTKTAKVTWGAVDTTKVGTVAVEGTVEGTTLKAKVNVTVKEKVLAVESVSAVKANTLKVVFNKAVDTTKAVFAVKKGTITANVASVTFADDKKSAELKMAAKLTKGDYTVTVTGLTETALTGTATGVLDETATKIEILSDKMAAVFTGANITSAKVSYSVTNQYGEDITSSAPYINWNSTFGGVTPSSGVLTITPSGSSLLMGQTGVITGVMTSPVVVVTKTVTVGMPASVDSVSFSSLYNADGKTINTASTYTDFVVVFDAKDQYGNDLTASDLNTDMVVASTNPTVFTVASSNPVLANQGPKGNQLGIQLQAPAGTALDGTSSIRMISKTTGKMFEFPVTVVKASTVDTFTMSAPEKTVAVGETVEIPFTAADQNGAAVTTFAALSGRVTFPTNGGSNGTLAFVNDYVNKKAVLNWTAPLTKGSYILMTLTPSGKTSQLVVEVKDAPVAGYISGLKSTVVTNVAVGGVVTLSKESFAVKDQYGRDLDITGNIAPAAPAAPVAPAASIDAGKYQFVIAKVSAADTYTTISSTLAQTKIDTNNTSVTIAGAKKGTTTYVAKLNVVKADGTFEEVAGSAFTFNVVVTDKADITSYEIGTIPTIYDQQGTSNTDYDVAVKVYGVKADGSKVVLPSTDYAVQTTDANLVYGTPSAGKLTADSVTYVGTATEATVTLIVTVNAADNGVVLTKEVKVSKAAPNYATLELDEDYSGYESAGLIAVTTPTNKAALDTIVTAAVHAEDQYGVEITSDSYTLVITNMAKDATTGALKTLNGYNGATATTLAAGDTFNVTAITANGKTIQFKVVCK